jgi:hypothetical protein
MVKYQMRWDFKVIPSSFSHTAYQSNPRYVPESKLLKSGKSYVVGRKTTCDLVVNHKKVSHDHGKFIVEGFSPNDVVRIPVSPIS